MSQALDKERILSLYGSHGDPWPDWRRSYLKILEEVQGWSEAELRRPERQARLWSLTEIAHLGPGEHVKVDGAFTDKAIVDAFVSLRFRNWHERSAERARALQQAYDHILSLLEAHTDRRPMAKLARACLALAPAHGHAAISWESHQSVKKLLLGGRRVKQIEAWCLGRARLRDVLGPESDLVEHVRRSIFCWWLQDHYEAIDRGEDPTATAVGDEASPEGPKEPEAEELALDPFEKQFKGISAISGHVDTFRAGVQAAEGGATPDDLVDTMRSSLGDEAPPPKSCRWAFNQLRMMGFLEPREGLWHPSERGLELIETDPPDILAETLLRRIFGLAHLLRLLRVRGPLSRRELADAMRAVYPRWSTDVAPQGIMGWARSLGFWEPTAAGLRGLTDYGRAWEERLPEALPSPPQGSGDPGAGVEEDEPETDVAAGSGELKPPSFAELRGALEAAEEMKGFVLDVPHLRALHAAWHCHPHKRFVILSGLSGTGKTAILRHYARAYCGLAGLDLERHLAVVAVSPDWRDHTGLLGYHNALHADPTFQAEPALRLILDAARHPSLPYFLVLDEMNLARVEHYFAPFLSAMETGDSLALHAETEEVNGVPPRVRWPRNLFIGGTVNMDESTHPFSDKVLDRAFTLEFWEADLAGFFERRPGRGPATARAEALLQGFYDALLPARRHFGYRTAGEVLAFLEAAAEGEEPGVELLDHALLAKVLPRVKGHETPALSAALRTLKALCHKEHLEMCGRRLAVMEGRLLATGITGFWS